VNFTREPIIETIITPKEGCKLVVRSSKAEGQEEYMVDAVEVVSFGQALFFRSLEKPKAFLVPVSDYEVVEAKESRVVLKSAQFDRTIKIGGGREGSIRRESQEEEDALPPALEEETAQEVSSGDPSFNRKRGERDRDRGRHRRRRASEGREEMRVRTAPQEPSQQGAPASQETTSAPFTHLIPPPTTLISETIGRYKEMLTPEAPPKLPEQSAPKEEKDDDDKGDPSSLSRVTTTSFEAQTFNTTQTHFSNLNDWTNFLS